MTQHNEADRIRELMTQLRALDWTGMSTDGLSYDTFTSMSFDDQMAYADGNAGLEPERFIAALQWIGAVQGRRAEALQLYSRCRASGIEGIVGGERAADRVGVAGVVLGDSDDSDDSA